MGDRPVEDYSGMPRELADVARRTLAEEQDLAPFPWNGLRPFTPEELADGCGGKALDVHSATGTVHYHATEPRGGFTADRAWCHAPGRASRPRAGYLLLAVGESMPATRYPFVEYFGGSGHEIHGENFAEWYALWRCFPERCPEAVAAALAELLGLLAELGPAGTPAGSQSRPARRQDGRPRGGA